MKTNKIRSEREYSVALSDEGGSEKIVTITVHRGTAEEQDALAMARARELAEEWARAGEWGDDGAVVSVRYALSDAHYEWDAHWIDVEIEPDQDE